MVVIGTISENGHPKIVIKSCTFVKSMQIYSKKILKFLSDVCIHFYSLYTYSTMYVATGVRSCPIKTYTLKYRNINLNH